MKIYNPTLQSHSKATGSFSLTGSLKIVTGDIFLNTNRKLYGTSSYANIAKTASYIKNAPTSLKTGSLYPITSSWSIYTLTSSKISGGTSFYIPLWKNNNTLSSSRIYQTASTIIIGSTTSVHPSAPEQFAVYGGTSTSYNLISGHGNINNYIQLNIKNFNDGFQASSDIVATNDSGDETTGYIDMGINSSQYTSSALVGSANDAYLYSTGNDLYIGNASSNREIIIFNGGLDAINNSKIHIHDQGTIGINTDQYDPTNPPSLQIQAPNASTNTLVFIEGQVDDFSQVNIINTSPTSDASSDLVLTNDTGVGNNVTGYVNLGINSSQYNESTGYIGGPNDAYLYSQAKHFHIGNATTGSNGSLYLFSGGTDKFDSNTRIFISGSGFIGLHNTNPQHKLDISGSVKIRNTLYDSFNNAGVSGSILATTGNSIKWIPNTGGSGGGGSSGTSGNNGSSGTSGSSGSSGTSGSSGSSGTSGVNGSSGSSGTSGTTGSSGTSGANGSSGTSGANGSSGSSGTSGANGSSGTSGANGSSGTSGANGSSGTSGANGSSGSSGTSGANGSSGTSGANGSSGTSGQTGSSGSSGANGSSGTSGQTGSSGSSGTSGANGSSGTSGANGSSGTSGANGSSGSSGTSGANGSSGTSGANGSSGTSGANGSSGSSGTSGANGSSGTSGQTGSSGTSGANGSSGTSGQTGSSGTSGTSGANGSSGTSGANGSSGSSGTSGANGSSGTSGANGSSGTSGANGSSGSSGTSGANGSSGTSGQTGSSGTSGTSGANGSSGTSGQTGSSGTSGTSGANGSSGTSGTNGSSGTSGANGSSGTSGANGSSGTSGANGSSGTSGAGFDTINNPFVGGVLLSDGSTNSANVSSSFKYLNNTLYVTGSFRLSGSMYAAPYIDNLITVGLTGSAVDFNSIKNAVDSITDASQNNTYTVSVAPGIYIEDTIYMKSWVVVRGDSSVSTVVSASNKNNSVFIGADQSMIIDMQVQGSTGTGSAAVVYSSTTTPQTNAIFYVENVRFGANYTNAKCVGTGSGNCIMQCSNVKYGGYPFTTGFYVTNNGSGIGRMQLRNVTSTNGGVTSTSNLVFAKADKPGCAFIVNGCLLTKAVGAAAGTGFYVYNGGSLRLTAVNFQRWDKGIYAPQSGSAPSIDAIALNFESCNTDVLIQHTGSTGKIQGTDNFLKTSIALSAPLYEVGQDPRKIVVAKKGGDFTSISSAVAWITGSNINNRFIVEVGPGQFTENTIDLRNKPYVSVVGADIQSTTVKAANTNHDIFKLGATNEISFMTLQNAGSGYAAISCNSISGSCTAHKISIFDCDYGVKVTGNTQNTQFYGEYIDINGSFSYGTYVSSSAGFTSNCNMENYYLFPSGSNSNIGNYVVGTNSELDLYTSLLRGNDISASVAIQLENGAKLESAGLDLQSYGYGIYVPNTGAAVRFRVVGAMIHSTLVNDIRVENTNTFGRYQGVSNHEKIYNVSPNFYWNFLDDNDGENDVTRKLSVTFEDGTHTDATTLIFKGSPMGVMQGGEITISGGLVINTQQGFGYLQDAIDTTVYKRIDWTDSTLALSANSNNYIYINDNGILSASGTLPDNTTNIILGRVVTNTSTVAFIDQSPFDGEHISNKLSYFNREALGPVFANGSIVTENVTPYKLNVTQGSYFFSENNFTPVGSSSLSFKQYYRSGSTFNISSTNTVLKNYYNSASVLTPLSSSYYTKHTLYLVGDGLDEQYFLLIGQNQYSSLIQAENANLPTPPTYFNDGVVSLASIYVQSGSSNIAQIQDIRPVIGFRAAGVNASAVHGNLLGLAADDHTQYLLVDGARQMSNDLGLNNNDLYNVNLITASRLEVSTLQIKSLTNDNAQTRFVVTDIDGNTFYRSGGANGSSGTSGANGSSGTSGANGSSGTSGANGSSGTSGANGSSGTSGANGSSGSSGTSGANGSSGSSGTSGANGSSGSSGTSGANGSSGSSGTSGANGSSGSSGTSGANGSSGSSGTSGANGSSGSSGTSGANGSSGSSGTSGANGSSGSSGTSGANGSSGTSGANGSSGTSGANGSSGTSGANGSSGSSGTSGANGSSGSSGTSGANGSSGTSGANGSSGTSGANGSSGSSGTSGANGSSGSSGTSGANGSSGTSGANGSSGTSGANGSSGSSGTSGANGSSGTSGANGSSGTSGANGSSGTSGQTGSSGTSGANGSSGTSGQTGSSGTSGANGSSGTSGQTGSSGTSGANGSSGTSGQTGSSGTSGANGSSGTSGANGVNGSSGTSGTSPTVPGSNDQILTSDGAGSIVAESLLTFDGAKLSILYQAGDEGGEILLNKAVTNTTLTGSGITIDSYRNKIRFFEQGGAARGAYIDITACAAGVGTNLLSGGGGSGTAGTSGTSGNTGSSGTSGQTGSSGTSGQTGSSGTSGANGSSGTSGQTGSSGTSGQTGSSGTSGQTGSSGTSGQTGSSGTSGQTGSSGTSGQTGSSGTSGANGSSGTSGQTGSSGTSGANGSSGTSGANGSSGTSGQTPSISDNVLTVRFEMGVSSTTAITTGAKGRKTVPYSGTIQGWKLVSDQNTTTTLDIWKTNDAIPTNVNSITGTAKPSLTIAQLNRSTTLTGWTTSVSTNDVFILEVESNDNATYLSLEMDILLS